MANRRRRLHEGHSFSDIRELREVSRESFLQFSKALQENRELLDTTASRHSWTKDLFRRFDSVAVSHSYDLVGSEDTFTLESCDPGELLQLLCVEAPKLAQLYLWAHRASPCSRARPWHAVIGFNEFLPRKPSEWPAVEESYVLVFQFP